MMVRSTHRTSRVVRAGFTLMEVMVVVAIILVLAGVGGVVYMRHLDDANEAKAKLDLKALSNAVEMYKSRTGRFPDSLQVLAQARADGAAYIEEDHLFDPWEQPYRYDPGQMHPTTRKPLISCMTPSGKQLSSWDTMRPQGQ